MRICASLLLPLLSLAVGCTDAASDDPGAAALPTTSGAFRGAYAVPVPPELAAAATFAVDHLDWTVVGDTVTLHYDLPVGLVGGDVRVDLTGRLAPGATEVVLTGPAGTGTCTSDGQRLTCVEPDDPRRSPPFCYHRPPRALPRDMALVERAAAAEYAGPVADRVAVATVFGQPDPIGIATRALTTRFITTCSSMPASARIAGRSPPRTQVKVTSSPTSRRGCWRR